MKTPQMPFPKLSAFLGIQHDVWLKFEDQHHYGSHKGRMLPFMIDEYKKNGITHFTISSSGNAALAAIRIINTHNKNPSRPPLYLNVYVGKNIEPKKLQKIKEEISETNYISLFQVENPKQESLKFEKENPNSKLLRGSTDPLGLTGYLSLAQELSKIENLKAVFVPTSSGTTAEGLYLGFKELGVNPEIHIIQTTFCHPIATHINSQYSTLKDDKSIASAIVDIVGRRKSSVKEAVEYSKGKAWVVSDQQVTKAMQDVEQNTGYSISPNSALSIAGLEEAISKGKTWDGPVACLITGN